MPQEIVDRIERELGIPGLAELLATQLAPTDLQSLLLEVARRRAAATKPTDVLRRYATDRFVRPAAVDSGQLQRFAEKVLDELSVEYEQIQLSPMCPLGTSSSLGGISQDWVVTTVRGGEIVSDPTSVLALECALRRRRDRTRPVRLSTTHRVLRAQVFDPPFTQHFGMLALCAADRAGGKRRFWPSTSTPTGDSSRASMSGPSPSTEHRESPRTTAAPRSESRSQGRRSWREVSSTGRKLCSETGRNDF